MRNADVLVKKIGLTKSGPDLSTSHSEESFLRFEVNGDELRIKLLKRKGRYRFNLDTMLPKNTSFTKIIVEGGDNYINISQGVLALESVDIQCGILEFGEEFQLQSNSVILNLTLFKNFSHQLQIKHLKISSESDKGRFINHGAFDLVDLLIQNTALENHGVFSSKKIEAQNSKGFVNHPEGLVKSEEVAGEFKNLVSKGLCIFEKFLIKCKTANIFGPFSFSIGQISCKKSAFFHPGSKLKFSKAFFCLSENGDIHFNGEVISSVGQLSLAGQNIFLGSTALIESYIEVSLLAQNTIRGEINSKIVNALQCCAKAQLLILDGMIKSSKFIQLLAVEYGKYGEYSNLQAEQLIFSGNFLFLYGMLSGDVSFKEKIQQLYLSDSSLIKDTNSVQIECLMVEAYGSVETKALDIEAKLSFWTGDQTKFKSQLMLLRSTYAELEGEFVVDAFAVDVSGLLRTSTKLSLHTEDPVEMRALIIEMHGEFRAQNSSLMLLAEAVLNDAWLNGFENIKITAKKVLVNAPASAIDSKNVGLSSATVLQDGKVSAQQAQIVSENRLYLGKGSIVDAEQAALSTHHEMFLSGKVNAQGSLSILAEQSINLDPLSALSSNTLQIRSPSISGQLNAKADNIVVQGKEEVRLLGGNVIGKEYVLIDGNEISNSANLRAKNLQFSSREENPQKASKLFLHSNGAINSQSLSSNHDQIFLDSPVNNSDTVTFHGKESVIVSRSANLKLTGKAGIKTFRLKIEGKIAGQEGGHLLAEAAIVDFKGGASVDLQGLQMKTDEVRQGGRLRAQNFFLQTRNIEFRPFSWSVGDKVFLFGAGSNSSVILYPKSYLKAAQLFITQFGHLNIAGNIRSKEINLEVEHILSLSTGVIGTEEAGVLIKCETFIHRGLIEAAQAYIKCNRYFLQLGWNAPSRIMARELNVLSSIHFNFLGNNKSNQASYLSFILFQAGFEECNFGSTNSFLSLRALPRSFSPFFLWDMFKNIGKGKITFLNTSYLQSITPLCLQLVREYDPTTALGLSLLANSYYMFSALRGLLGSKKPEEFVDVLPILLGIKNAGLAGSTLVQNGIDLANDLKIEFPKWYYDLNKFFTVNFKDWAKDLPSDFWEYVEGCLDFYESFKDNAKDFLHKLDLILSLFQLENVKSQKVSKSADVYKTDDGVTILLSENEESNGVVGKPIEDGKPINPAPIDENKAEEISFLQKVQAVVEHLALPMFFILSPRFTDDSVLSFRLLNPTLTGVEMDRGGYASLSFFSPDVAVAANQQSLGKVYCFSKQYVFTSNFSGSDVYLSAQNGIHNLSVHAKNFYLVEGDKIRVYSISLEVEELKPMDINATHYQFKYQRVENEGDLFRLMNQWAIFRCQELESVSYNTYHDLCFSRNLNTDWSCYFRGTKITVDSFVKLSSKETLGLITTENDIVNNGNIDAKVIIEDSADHVIETTGTSKSKKTFIHARRGIDLNSKKIETQVGYLISDWGDIKNTAGTEKAKHFLYVDAVRGDVIGICKKTPTVTNGSEDFIYTPAVFHGGDGVGFKKCGLVVHAGGKVINDASEFSAEGKYHVNGEMGVVNLERHNEYVSRFEKHRRWLVVKKMIREYSLRQQKAIYKSNTTGSVIESGHGRIDSTCVEFFSPEGSVIFYSYEQPIFREIIFTSRIENKTTLCSLKLAERNEQITEYLSSSFHAPKAVVLIVRHGDIILPDVTIDMGYLLTRTWNGRTIFLAHPTVHNIQESYWGYSCNFGPFRLSGSLSPSQPTKTSVDTAPFDQVKNGDDRLNLLNTSVGLASKILSGDYLGLVKNTSAGISIGRTKQKSHVETANSHYLRVGRWDDYSREVSISGMSGAAGQMNLYRARHFSYNGQELHYYFSTQTWNLGGGYSPFLNFGWLSAGAQTSHGQGQVYAINTFYVGELYLGRPIVIDINNAKFFPQKARGNCQLNLHSDYNDYQQESHGASLSTNGNVGASFHRSDAHEIPEPAEFHFDENHYFHISGLNSERGRISGKGFDDSTPDSLKQTPIESQKSERGFDFAFDIQGQRLISLGYQNTVETRFEQIQKTLNGLSMYLNEKRKGPNLHIDIPYNIIETAQGTYLIFSGKTLDEALVDLLQISKNMLQNLIDIPHDLIDVFRRVALNQTGNPVDFVPLESDEFVNEEIQNSEIKSSEQEMPDLESNSNEDPESQDPRDHMKIGIPNNYLDFLDPNHYASYFELEDTSTHSKEKPEKKNEAEKRVSNSAFQETEEYSLSVKSPWLLHPENYAIYFDPFRPRSRFNYPIVDYGVAVLKGGWDVILDYWDLVKGTSIWWTDSALRSFNTFAPGILSEEILENSNARIEQRWMLAKNVGNTILDLSTYFEASLVLEGSTSDSSSWGNYLQMQAKVQEDFQPLIIAVGNGVSWLWNDATGPEMLERGIAFLLPYKLEGELFNFNYYKEAAANESFLYRGSLTEPERAFNNGFNAKGQNLDLMAHADKPDYYFKDQKVSSDSGYVSTSTSKEMAARYTHLQPGECGFLYEINPQENAIDIYKALTPGALQALDFDSKVAFFIGTQKPEFFEPFGLRAGLYITLKAENERVIPFKIHLQEIKGACKVDIEEVKFDNPRHPNFGFTDKSSYLRTPIEPFIPNPYYRPSLRTQKMELPSLHWLSLPWTMASIYAFKAPTVSQAIDEEEVNSRLNASFLPQENVLFLCSMLAPSGFFFGQALIQYLNSRPTKEGEFLFRSDTRETSLIFKSGFQSTGNNLNVRKHVFPDEEFMTDSAYISTTRSKEVAIKFPHHSIFSKTQSETTYIYQINSLKNAIDGVAALRAECPDIEPEDLQIYSAEQEKLVFKKISSRDIKGAWKVKIEFELSAEPIQFNIPEDKTKLAYESWDYDSCYKQTRTLEGDFIPNPNYRIPSQFLWASLRCAGYAFMGLGAVSDAYVFYLEWDSSQKTGDYSNTYREGSRIIGGWSGAFAGGAAGARAGGMLCAPIYPPVGSLACGLVGRVGGSIIGYQLGGKLGTEFYARIAKPKKPYSSGSQITFFSASANNTMDETKQERRGMGKN